ncbi:hypothetical protein O3G_MSEX000671 [Manduca sexta]|nr:hypothetical protein O3G_MSEX000671 [Manduca sexta]
MQPSKDYKIQAKMLAVTKAVIIDKIEKELSKKKGEHKTHESHLQTIATVAHPERPTKRHYFGKWRESQEAADRAIIVEQPISYSVLDQQSLTVTMDPARPTITRVSKLLKKLLLKLLNY